MNLGPNDLARIPHRAFLHRELLRGRNFTGVSTDSRAVRKGNLFVALRGEHFDGHSFLDGAFAAGAAAAVVEREEAEKSGAPRPLLLVDDSTHALGDLAGIYRRKFRLPVLAIGGSNGKTTTKEMIASVLKKSKTVLSTDGNLNNQIGVPQTIFRLQEKHKAAVVEIGTNHPGEIDYLCGIVAPTHGLITNIGREHLEFFGSLDGVAAEEGRRFACLKRGRKTSTLFVNADDPRVTGLAKGGALRITYGFTSRRANIRGRLLGADKSGCERFEFIGSGMKKPMEVQLSVPGEHSAGNALAAAAVGLAFRVPPASIRKALESFRPASRRLEVLRLRGVIVYNDTYNANPDSMMASLRTLARAPASGKKIAVLADMRELGDAGPAEHARIGIAVRELDIEYLLTYGALARYIHDAAGIPMAMHYDQKNVLAEYLAELVAPGDVVLVKGSRGMKMEDVVVFLEERLRAAVVPLGTEHVLS